MVLPPVALIVSVVGLFVDASKKYAVAGACVSAVELLFWCWMLFA